LGTKTSGGAIQTSDVVSVPESPLLDFYRRTQLRSFDRNRSQDLTRSSSMESAAQEQDDASATLLASQQSFGSHLFSFVTGVGARHTLLNRAPVVWLSKRE
jgi:hypothetical protein